ncbi:MAG TPA: MFS transporter [Rhizomicrobium sp.]|nr:MFS transporter [Rhizomicrobium sp.]
MRSARLSAPFPILFFASAAHAMNHVLLTLYLTLVLVVAKDWHLGYNTLIALWAPGAMLVGLGAPLAGWLGDRWGETRVLVLCFALLGISAMLAGLARTALQLEGALALLGLAGSVYHPVGIAWVVKHARARGRAIASTGIAGSFGVAMGPITAGALATLFGWRVGFILPGALTMGLGALLAWFYLTGRIADRHGDAVEHAVAHSRADATRAFAAMAVTMTATLVIYSGFGTALPKMIEMGTKLGVRDNASRFFAIGLAAGAIQLIGASGQFAGGRFADKGHAKLAYMGGFAALAVILPLLALSRGLGLAAAGIATVFLFEWIAPIETTFLARFTPQGRRGLVFGIRYALAAIGTPAGVWLVAKLYDPADGFFYLLATLAGLSVVALGCAVFIPVRNGEHVPLVAEPGALLEAGE